MFDKFLLYSFLYINFSTSVDLNCKCQQDLGLLCLHSFKIFFHFVGSIRVTTNITSKCAGIPLSFFPDLFSFFKLHGWRMRSGEAVHIEGRLNKAADFSNAPTG